MISSVAGYLNDNGILRRKDRQDDKSEQEPFTREFISRIINNPVYCGKLVYGRRTNKKDKDGRLIKPDPEQRLMIEGMHEPIITEEWERVQEKRRKNSAWGKKVIEPERIGLLSGLIKCPVCGSGMVARSRRQINKNHGGYYKIRHYYYCRYYGKANGRTCSFHRTYRQEKIDDAVFEIVSSLCTYPEFVKWSTTAYRTRVRKKSFRTSWTGKEKSCEMMNWSLGGLETGSTNWMSTTGIMTENIMTCRNGWTTSTTGSAMLRMTDLEKKEFFQNFIDYIEIYPDKKANERILKRIHFRFPVYYKGQPGDILWLRSENGVETVVLMSRKT